MKTLGNAAVALVNHAILVAQMDGFVSDLVPVVSITRARWVTNGERSR